MTSLTLVRRIAARPSMGKTAFVMNIAENASIEAQQ